MRLQLGTKQTSELGTEETKGNCKVSEHSTVMWRGQTGPHTEDLVEIKWH